MTVWLLTDFVLRQLVVGEQRVDILQPFNPNKMRH